MNPSEQQGRSGLASLRLLLAATIGLGIPLLLFGAGPVWWSNPSLTTSGTAPVISGTSEDYAAANQGQVKNIAITAVNEMNIALKSVGGAGSALTILATSLSATSGSTSDFAVVNLGQLKTVAKPFYDRLFSIDYSGPPLTSSTTYPWISSGLTAEDYAAANIGQVKNLFSFDLTYSSDGNSLPNWWREYYFGTLSVSSTSTVSLDGGDITYLEAWQQHLSPLPGPVFSPAGGTLQSSTNVTISASGSDTIYYTTNGSDPAVSGSLYSTALPVSGLETIRAIAYSGSIATLESAAVYSLASNPTALSAGAYHSLEIKGDGTVWAWGANCQESENEATGQLGTGNYVDQWYPVEVPLPVGAISIAAGDYHSLAVTSDGKAWAWGSNANCQLGLPDSIYESATSGTVSGATNVIAVAAGSQHSLALTSSNTVLAWGDNYDGQLGFDTGGSNQYSPAEVMKSGSASVGLSGVSAIAAGGNSSVALTGSGAVWIWGDNSYGQCCQVSGSGQYTEAIEVTNTNIKNIVAVAAGTNHILALTSSNTVWAWGLNTNGQLGGGTYSSTPGTPVHVLTSTGTLTGIVSIGAGNDFSIAVKNDGTVWMWGNLGAGQLAGSGTYSKATQITGVSGAVMAAASLHVLIGGSNGSVTTFGVNTNGELGVGTSTSSTTPLLSTVLLLPEPPQPTFSPDSGIYTSPQAVVISCTDSFATIYYTTDGSTPGPSNGSVVTSGDSVSISAPTMLRASAVDGGVSSLTKSAAYHMGYQMLAGGQHSILLNTDGTVYTWGANDTLGLSAFGQLGLGWNSDEQVFPQLITGLSGSATAVATGEINSAAVINSGTNYGTVWVWGDNTCGQCGVVSSTTTFSIPFQVPGLTGATAVACGWYHSVAITGSATLMAWGDNSYGELGNGNTSSSPSSPMSVLDISNVKAVAAGQGHSLALLKNGTVYAWGDNEYGELGTTGTNNSLPAQVLGLSNIIAIATSQFSSFALRSDGTVWAWGQDYNDQLADDLDTEYLDGEGDLFLQESAPVLVGSMRDVTEIAVNANSDSGANHGVALCGNGTILVWGDNANDALISTVPANQSSVPVPAPSVTLMQGTTSLASIVTMVSAGDWHTLVVLNTSGVQTLWGWGDDTYGELGDGALTSTYTPQMVQFSGYPTYEEGLPYWQALELGINTDGSGVNSEGVPYGIANWDGEGVNPTLPYTPYTLPPGGPNSPPTIYITIPIGATLH